MRRRQTSPLSTTCRQPQASLPTSSESFLLRRVVFRPDLSLLILPLRFPAFILSPNDGEVTHAGLFLQLTFYAHHGAATASLLSPQLNQASYSFLDRVNIKKVGNIGNGRY